MSISEYSGYSKEEVEELKTHFMPFAYTIQRSKNRWRIYFQQGRYNKAKHKYSKTFMWDAWKNKKCNGNKLLATIKRVVDWRMGWGYAPRPVDKFIIDTADEWRFINDSAQQCMVLFSLRKIMDDNPWKKYHLHKIQCSV